jgi:hypothetical protein
MSTKVFPMGKAEVLVAASAKIAAVSKSPFKVYYLVGYPNQPSAWLLLKQVAADEDYASAAFSAATLVRIEAGPSEVFFGQGTDEVVFEKRGLVNQPAPVALDATGALTAAMVASGIVTSTTAAAVTGTLPTGTVLKAAFQLAIGEAIDFSVIATGANAFTVAVAADVTNVGSLIVATGTSGRFRLRRTADLSHVVYRLS